MPGPSWKKAEELVALIEEALAPDALVEHNLMLPVIGQDRSRQCDVVVRFNRAPRDFFFIVEVQQRGSRPTINEFGGWLRKMEEVGAAGLICVSEAGFPDSIIEDVAKRIGPKVRLVTLNEEGPHAQWAANLRLYPCVMETSFEINVDEAKRPEYWDSTPKEHVSANLAGPVLSSTGALSDARSLGDAIHAALVRNDPHKGLPPEAVGALVRLNLTLTSSDSEPMWLHAKEGTFRLRSWEVRCAIRRIDREVPVEYSKWTYTQEFHDSVLAWVARGPVTLNGIRTEISWVFSPNERGFLRVRTALRRL